MQNYLPIWNISPLDQFIIGNLFSMTADSLLSFEFSLTNIGLSLITTTTIILFINK